MTNEKEQIDLLKLAQLWVNNGLYSKCEIEIPYEIEAVILAALNKQMPVKPIQPDRNDQFADWDFCPVCARFLRDSARYCDGCGQALER